MAQCEYYVMLVVNLPLHEMTIRGSPQWNPCGKTCSQTPEAIESPEWHKEILDERQSCHGVARFVDWESSKANICEKILVRRS